MTFGPTRRVAALATVGVIALAGCGSQNAGHTAQTQAQKLKSRASAQLSPQGRNLLQQAQALAASVAGTANQFAQAKISRTQALSQLQAERSRAQTIVQQAQTLPATSKARGQVNRLSGQVSSTAQSLRSKIQAGQVNVPTDVQPQVAQLESVATQVYNDVRGLIPPQARDDIQKALSQLRANTGA